MRSVPECNFISITSTSVKKLCKKLSKTLIFMIGFNSGVFRCCSDVSDYFFVSLSHPAFLSILVALVIFFNYVTEF